MAESDEYFPDFPDEVEAQIQRIAEETACTRDEVINMLMKNFLNKVDQAADETELTGFARKVKKAMLDSGLQS